MGLWGNEWVLALRQAKRQPLHSLRWLIYVYDSVVNYKIPVDQFGQPIVEFDSAQQKYGIWTGPYKDKSAVGFIVLSLSNYTWYSSISYFPYFPNTGGLWPRPIEHVNYK